MMELALERQAVAQRGKRLEYFTIAWNTLEGLVAVAAGMMAGSISLVGFGIDSFIEVTSGGTLLWRMSVDRTFIAGSAMNGWRSESWEDVSWHWPLISAMNPSPI